MRRKRRFMIGALAVVSGGIAAYAALEFLDARPVVAAPSDSSVSTTQVAVAVRDLPIGSMVGEEDVKLVDWPVNALPPGHIPNAAQAVGRGLMTAVYANEPLLDAKMADRGSGGLPIIIPEGMRAMSVKVDEVVGVAGFVVPGTSVDVVSIVAPPGEESISRVILQNVRTLTAGQSVTRDADGEPMTVTVITLLVSPDDAERLALASTQGRIQLALRNTLDQEPVETPGVRIAGLHRAAPAPATAGASRPRPVPQASPTVIEVFRGGVRTLITY